MIHAARLRPKVYHLGPQRWDPSTASASSMLGMMTDFTTSLSGTFIDPCNRASRADGGISAVGAVGQGLTGMTTAVAKGALVDVPLALAGGFKNTPQLYGETVRDHGTVTDWKSGGVVAAKACYHLQQFLSCLRLETKHTLSIRISDPDSTAELLASPPSQSKMRNRRARLGS